MPVHVRLAERADLVEAGAVMRRVLESDLGGYQSQWHADLDDLAAAYFQRLPARVVRRVPRQGDRRHRGDPAVSAADTAEPGVAGPTL